MIEGSTCDIAELGDLEANGLVVETYIINGFAAEPWASANRLQRLVGH